MKEIFTDIYKKLAGFFQPQQQKEDASKEVACNRLKLVLMQDRTNLTPQLLERMRGELIDLLSKYVEMDREALELNFAQEGDSMALMLSIPVLRAKEEEEIQAMIKAEEEAKAEAEAKAAEEASAEESEEEGEEIEGLDEELEVDEDESVCSCGCTEDGQACDCEPTCGCGCNAEEQGVANPFNVSNQGETKPSKKKKSD